MEINAANFAGHGIQVSSTKKSMEKKIDRFGELSPEEIQEFMDNAAPVTTKKPQSSG